MEDFKSISRLNILTTEVLQIITAAGILFLRKPRCGNGCFWRARVSKR
ncbi:MAG: hypothetical protein NC253_13070 [Ruminococcus sp.]|nr:hypothetical protein [Ruminococcus sp.]MCM1382659.1 hypothetical protein [Muribaculaceae bacterium]